MNTKQFNQWSKYRRILCEKDIKYIDTIEKIDLKINDIKQTYSLTKQYKANYMIIEFLKEIDEAIEKFNS